MSFSSNFFVNNRKTDLSMAVLLIMNKADISARESESEEGSGRKPLELVQNAEHQRGLRATAAVVHAEGARMARGHSTQYASVFWDNLCRASRFCRQSLGGGKDTRSPSPVPAPPSTWTASPTHSRTHFLLTHNTHTH